MRLRKQREPAAGEDPGAPDDPEEVATGRGAEEPSSGDEASSAIADGALTREREYVEGAHPISKDDEAGDAKSRPRREGWRRRGRASDPAEDGIAPEVLSRLSKYRMTAELLERQKSRRVEDEEEPWRKT